VGKRLNYLKFIIPELQRIALLYQAEDVDASELQAADLVARSSGMEVTRVPVMDPSDFQSAFETISRQRCQALYISVGAFTTARPEARPVLSLMRGFRAGTGRYSSSSLHLVKTSGQGCQIVYTVPALAWCKEACPRAEPAVDSPTKAAATTRTATPPEATEEAQAGTYLAEPVSGFRKGALVSHVNFLAARSGFA
jgi:hypothetical protein